MSLVWHIVCKDGRRLAGPLALWLVLLLAHTLFVLGWDGVAGIGAPEFEGRRYFVNTCGAMIMGIGFILAAWLVMEDSLVSTRAFWPTRPISGARLLAAKVLGAGLFLSVLPVAVLVPVWLWCGFSWSELARAVLETALPQALCSVAALALGAVTATSGQFLVRLVGGLLGLPFLTTYALGVFPVHEAVSASLESTRTLIVMGLLGLTPVLMAGHQFLTRRVTRTWLIFGLGAGLMVVAGRWWPWDFMNWFQTRPAAGAATDSGLVFTADRLATEALHSLERQVPVRLGGTVSGLKPGWHVRVDQVRGWWIAGDGSRAGPVFAGVNANGQPATGAVRHLAGLPAPVEDTASWTASAGEAISVLQTLGAPLDGNSEAATAAGGRLGGVVRATLLEGAVLGELPVRVGATLQVGSSLTRVNDVRWVDDLLVVQLEERDAWLTGEAGAYSHNFNPARHRIRPRADGFVVVNRALGLDRLPAVQEIGTMKVNAILVGRRNLVITPPAPRGEAAEPSPDWLEGAVIMKVRFHPAGRISQPLSSEVPFTPR